MRRSFGLSSWCLLALLGGCGQKGGLYRPDAAPATVHKPAPITLPATPPPAASPSTTAPPATPPSSPAPVAEPSSPPDAAPAATPPADDPATRRKLPTTPDPSTSQ